MKLLSLGKRLGRAAKSPADGLTRESIAKAFVRGEGIEIGALQFPLPLPEGARATYLDRMAVPELRTHYPELENAELVGVDVLDDGERLRTIADGSQDFVIANHFLEHCQNPIGAIESFLRVLRVGGIAYIAVPDKRFSFDREREVTSFEHVLRDYREGPEWSRRSHYEEWIRVVHEVKDDAWAENRIAHLMETDYSIHFHVWTQSELLMFLLALRDDLRFAFDLKLFAAIGEECVCVLKKDGPREAAEARP